MRIKGENVNDITWAKDKDGLIKIDGIGVKGQAVHWYVRFESSKKGWYGATADKVDKMLTAISPRALR